MLGLGHHEAQLNELRSATERITRRNWTRQEAQLNVTTMSNRDAMLAKIAELETEVGRAVAGGGEKYVDRHHRRGKLLARERIELLLDPDSYFLELSPLAGWGSDFTVGASVVTGIGVIEGVECMITANDPSVKGGASNPWTVRKLSLIHI